MIFRIGTREFLGLLLAICILVCSSAIKSANAWSQSENLRLPIVKRDTLLNGLQILTLEKTGSGGVNLKVRIKSGAMFDLAGKGGLADLTAGMLLKGGGGYTANAVEETLRQFGLRINIEVTWDVTDIEIAGPVDAAEEMFDLLGRLLIAPAFEQKEFDALKANRLAAIKTENGDTESLTHKAMESIFSGHPYGKPLRGTAESVQQISKFDLTYYHKKFYLANNAMLLASGGITAEAVTKFARSKLGGWRKGDIAPASFRPPNLLTSRRVIILNKPELQTAQAIVAQIAFSRRSPDYLAALVMSTILRNQFEKTFGNVGEIQFDPRLLDGPMIISLKSPPTEIVNQIDKALQLLTSQQTHEPSSSEVESAKAQVVSKMSELLNNNPAQLYFDMELYGLGKDYLITFAERINAVTAVDVEKAAQVYLKPKTTAIVIAAPAKVYENEWKKLGDVTVTP